VIEELESKVSVLEEDVRSRDISIYSLSKSCEEAQAVANKLNRELSDNRLRFKEEKLALQKELKSNIKQLKKELGKTISENVKLKKKLDRSADFDIDNCAKRKKKKPKKAIEPSVPNIQI